MRYILTVLLLLVFSFARSQSPNITIRKTTLVRPDTIVQPTPVAQSNNLNDSALFNVVILSKGHYKVLFFGKTNMVTGNKALSQFIRDNQSVIDHNKVMISLKSSADANAYGMSDAMKAFDENGFKRLQLNRS